VRGQGARNGAAATPERESAVVADQQSGIVVIDVLRSTYDVVIVAGGTTTVFDAVGCVTGPGFVLLE